MKLRIVAANYLLVLLFRLFLYWMTYVAFGCAISLILLKQTLDITTLVWLVFSIACVILRRELSESEETLENDMNKLEQHHRGR